MKHIKRDCSFKAWVRPPLCELRGWGRAQNLPFSECGHVEYQIKVNNKCINTVANIFKRSKFNFSGQGHVAYQFKVNNECSMMQAHIMS